jgi:hypothetical protein
MGLEEGKTSGGSFSDERRSFVILQARGSGATQKLQNE